MAEFGGESEVSETLNLLNFLKMNSNTDLFTPHELFAFSNDDHNQQLQEVPFNFTYNTQSSFVHLKAADVSPTFQSSACGTEESMKEKGCGRKRKRNNEKEVELPIDVIHVRARRGQATDSRSLAERVRREKINEKLRCLHGLVPGCYKSMGIGEMLDVIIKYVQSLQNQIEFLSMKLSAASLFHDFNSSDMDAVTTLQATDAYEAPEMEMRLGEEYEGFVSSI